MASHQMTAVPATMPSQPTRTCPAGNESRALHAGLIALFGSGPEIPTRWDRGGDGGRADSPLRTVARAEAAITWAAHHIAEGRAYFLSANHVSCWPMRRGWRSLSLSWADGLIAHDDVLRHGGESQRDQDDCQRN